MSDSNYYIGLISGTSVDGVDCALVQFTQDVPKVVSTIFQAMTPELRAKILRLCQGTCIDMHLYGQVDIEIGRVFANSVTTLLHQTGLKASDITAIGSHGQTVFHDPSAEFPFTLQLGDPNTIAQLTGITTVADFRRRDMAVGGEGAPLAPLLHRNCFRSPTCTRVILNIGGISNITVLDTADGCLAFDTGPGNVLMDFWVEQHLHKTFDKDGNWAASGSVDAELVELFLDEPYFALLPPKSTGRELFNAAWLETKLKQLKAPPRAADVQASLLELTAQSIARAIRSATHADEVYVCGGGAANGALMQRLQTLLGEVAVASTAALGVDPDWVEAAAFAWMAKQTFEGKPIDTSALTGASEPIILGGIYRV